jgi:hypothetical protein
MSVVQIKDGHLELIDIMPELYQLNTLIFPLNLNYFSNSLSNT